MRKATALFAALLFAVFLPITTEQAATAHADDCQGELASIIGVAMHSWMEEAPRQRDGKESR